MSTLNNPTYIKMLEETADEVQVSIDTHTTDNLTEAHLYLIQHILNETIARVDDVLNHYHNQDDLLTNLNQLQDKVDLLILKINDTKRKIQNNSTEWGKF